MRTAIFTLASKALTGRGFDTAFTVLRVLEQVS